jgi:hypothetical protein
MGWTMNGSDHAKDEGRSPESSYYASHRPFARGIRIWRLGTAAATAGRYSAHLTAARWIQRDRLGVVQPASAVEPWKDATMNSFGDRLAGQRAAAAAEKDAETTRLARLHEETKAAMGKLTADFADRADTIGLRPRPVVTLRSGTRRVKTGLFSSEERGAVFYEETLGEGWVVTDHDPLQRTEYGEPYTQLSSSGTDVGSTAACPAAARSRSRHRRRPRKRTTNWVRAARTRSTGFRMAFHSMAPSGSSSPTRCLGSGICILTRTLRHY